MKGGLGGAYITAVVRPHVTDELRGRVAALYVMSFLGMSPVGSLCSGWLASLIGSQYALALFGAVAFMASLLYAHYFPRIRQEILPLYESLEIPRHES